MAKPARVIGVTIALSITGAIVGAICGLLALLPILIAPPPYPSQTHIGPIPLSELALAATQIGAVVGAVCGPTLAFSLLRNAPLWRVVTWAAVGTVVGSFGGWAITVIANVDNPLPIFGGALFGFVAAGVILRRRVARARSQPVT